jgi:putative heme iron utilization protein
LELAREVKQFAASQQAATLSTISHTIKGYPFGSLVPYDLIPDSGEPIIFISRISEHYKNLKDDPRASLMISDAFSKSVPQAHSRTTLVGEFLEVDARKVEQKYWQKYPNAPEFKISANFQFFQMKLLRVRWIAGFGAIRWISPEDYRQA